MLENFLLRYALNLIFTFIVVRFIYYPKYRNNDFVFTFFLFNTILFVLCYLLAEADLKFGFAFGLFALFSMFRYRTVTVPIGEMGYFFKYINQSTKWPATIEKRTESTATTIRKNIATIISLASNSFRYYSSQEEGSLQIPF